MSPYTRRDLLIGGAVVGVGIGLLIFAFFGNDESLRAPRWVVAIAGTTFLVAGGIPLMSALRDRELHPRGAAANLGFAFVMLVLATLAAWMMAGVGPEGVTLEIPIDLGEDTERTFKGFVFYGLLGAALVACVLGAALGFNRALPALGRTGLVALVAPIVGIAVWVAIEMQRQAGTPQPPALFLSFDRKFPGDDYLARVNGVELRARPGKQGTGLFISGNGDSLEVETPVGYNTAHGLTLELWIKRENWINPYIKGSRTQTVVSLELESEYRGRPEVRHVAFSLQLVGPRVREDRRGLLPPEEFSYRPTAFVGDVRLTPLRSVAVPAERWIHVAVVYDRFVVDRMRLYVDGRLVARALPWSSAPGFADLRTLRVGTWVERNGAYRGMVDELKVYARALSEDEIAANARR